jgi:hypothetical protein
MLQKLRSEAQHQVDQQLRLRQFWMRQLLNQLQLLMQLLFLFPLRDV